jgi:hypothetical protein
MSAYFSEKNGTENDSVKIKKVFHFINLVMFCHSVLKLAF